jgi:hypothetical protein
MSRTIDVGEMERRAKKYWTVDGLPELVMGGLWMVWGAAWIVGESLPRGRVSDLYWTFAPLLLVGSGVAGVWATKRLKATITFPRGGYVGWKDPTRAQRLTAAAVATVAAVLLAAVAATGRARGFDTVAAPLVGVVLSLAFVIASVTQRAPHLLVLAAIALVLGFAMSSWTAGYDALNWMLVALGAATLAFGAARLWWFLRSHPVGQHA